MTVSYKDRVYVTTATTGTGTLTQGATITGYRAPTAADDGKTFEIQIVAVDSSGIPTGQEETCLSVYTHLGTSWSRGALIGSSTGSRISFSAGTKRIAVVASSQTFAKIGNFVDLANWAILNTSGIGTQASPWDLTGFSPTAGFLHRARTGWYSYSTSPNWALNNLYLFGEAAVYFKHTGSGVGFNVNGGTSTDPFITGIRIENINLVGSYASGTGTISYSQGSAAIVGVGTHFLTELAVGKSVTTGSGTSSAEGHLVATITDDTHATVDANWVSASGGQVAFKIGSTTDGLYVGDVSNVMIDNCSARDVAGNLLNVKGNVNVGFRNFQGTADNPAWHTFYQIKPQVGAVFDTLGGSAFDTTTWMRDSNFDYFQTKGIWIKSTTIKCALDNVIAEVATGPAVGFQIEGQSNSLHNCWAEGINSGTDFNLSGTSCTDNKIDSCYGTHGGVVLDGNTVANKVIGGQFANISNSGYHNAFFNVQANLGSGTWTESGHFTTRFACYGNGIWLANLLGVGTAPGYDDGGSLTPNMANGEVFQVGISAPSTIQNPTNPSPYQLFELNLISSGAGNWALTFGSAYRFVGCVAPATTGASGNNVWLRGRYNSTYSKVDITEVRSGLSISAFTPSNDSTLRSFDVSTVTTTQLANVVATLIRDLKAQGGIG